MDKISLDALATVVAVARAGSVTGAAAELGLTQSTVSGQLATLERRLGYRLFDRTQRGMKPTGRGRALLAQVGGQIDSAIEAVTALTDGYSLTRTVFFGGPVEFLSVKVLPQLSERLVAGPEVRVRFGEATDLLAGLQDGALDLVVSTIQPRLRGIEFAPLFDEDFVLVMHPRLVDDFQADPDAVPVIAYGEELPIIRRYWHTVFERPPSRLRAAMTVPDLRVLADLAATGVGMTVLPVYLARDYLNQGSLVDPVRPEFPPLNTLYLAQRRSRPGASPSVDAVVKAVHAVASG